jgi:hypothetical protein
MFHKKNARTFPSALAQLAFTQCPATFIGPLAHIFIATV